MQSIGILLHIWFDVKQKPLRKQIPIASNWDVTMAHFTSIIIWMLAIIVCIFKWLYYMGWILFMFRTKVLRRPNKMICHSQVDNAPFQTFANEFVLSAKRIHCWSHMNCIRTRTAYNLYGWIWNWIIVSSSMQIKNEIAFLIRTLRTELNEHIKKGEIVVFEEKSDDEKSGQFLFSWYFL